MHICRLKRLSLYVLPLSLLRRRRVSKENLKIRILCYFLGLLGY